MPNRRTHAAEWADRIVSIHMTSKGSGAYQSASIAQEMARSELPGVRIKVLDTLQVSMVHGWAAIEAARAAQAGAELDEVIAAARYVARTGWMIQTADTLKYLYMGGRIGRAQHLVGTLLNIKPLIVMEDVPLVNAMQNLARHAGINYVLDPRTQLCGEAPQPSVTIRWENVTARQALKALLDNYNLERVDRPHGIAIVQPKDAAGPKVNVEAAARDRLEVLLQTALEQSGNPARHFRGLERVFSGPR